jgi:23S rRNA (cytidine1920-2'-O)/16S rRNA (cytidine1409-2'-O)-methyltransferase
VRLDLFLVAGGHAPTRARARQMIDAACVTVNGSLVTKPAQMVGPSDVVAALPLHHFVSRGGLKLSHALDHFGITAQGQVCLDIGQSTGGFTDVLLRRGADHVIGIEVGHGQLDNGLRADPRVTVFEKADIRTLTPTDIKTSVSLIVCDVSFISLQKALAGIARFFKGQGTLIVLFKPQFEVGRNHIGKGGIVTDLAATVQARLAVQSWVTREGAEFLGWTPSPITGGDGNQEWLFAARF